MGFVLCLSMECSFLKGVSRLKNARIWWEVARRSGGARKFRVVRLVIDTVQGTGITKLNHTEFSRFIGRKQCFLSVFFAPMQVRPVLSIQRMYRAERYSFQLCIAGCFLFWLSPFIFCLLSLRSFAFLCCKGKCWRHWLKFRLAFHKKSPPFG